MSRETLERWRTLVPGIAILGYLYCGAVSLGVQGVLSADSWFVLKREILLTGIAIILGSLYRAARLRDPVFRPPIERVQANIKNRLTNNVLTDPYFAPKVASLQEGRKLMEVFYRFVDEDKSLTEKAKGVRANGLALSSAADVCLISLCFAALFAVVTVFYRVRGLEDAYVTVKLYRISSFALLSVGAAMFALIAWMLLPVFEREHLELSNEQLDYIEIHYKKELRERLYSLI